MKNIMRFFLVLAVGLSCRQLHAQGPAPDSVPATNRAAVAPGVDPAAYDRAVKENLRLRGEKTAIERMLEDARKMNLDLMEKARRTEAAPKPDIAADARTAIERLQAENQSLCVDQARLREELNRSRMAATTAVPATVAAGSDLVAKLTGENVALRTEVQRFRDAERKALDERDRLAVQGRETTDKAGQNANALKEKQEEVQLLKRLVLKLHRELDKAKGDTTAAGAGRSQPPRETIVPASVSPAASDLAAPSAAPVAVGDTDGLVNAAVGMVRDRRYADAEKVFLIVLKRDPQAADVNYNLAILYDRYLEKPSKAAPCYRKFLEVSPSNQEAEAIRMRLIEIDLGL